MTMKQLTPVRLIRNNFDPPVAEADSTGAAIRELTAVGGRGRAKKGMFEGNLDEGELEVGQVSSLLDRILPAGDIVKKVWREFMEGLQNPILIL